MTFENERLADEAGILIDSAPADTQDPSDLPLSEPALGGSKVVLSAEDAAPKEVGDVTIDEYALRYDTKRGLSLKGLGRAKMLTALQAEAVRREHAMDPATIAFELEPEDIDGFLHPAKGESARLDHPGGAPLFGLNTRAQYLSPRWIAEAEAHYGQGFVREALWPTYAWEDVRDNFLEVWGDFLKPDLSDNELLLAYIAVYHLPNRAACWSFFESRPTFGEMRREVARVGQLALRGPAYLPQAAQIVQMVKHDRPTVLVTHDQFRTAWQGALKPDLSEEELVSAFEAIFSPLEGDEHGYWQFADPNMSIDTARKLTRYAEDRRSAGPEAIPQQAAEIAAKQRSKNVIRVGDIIARILATVRLSKPLDRAA